MKIEMLEQMAMPARQNGLRFEELTGDDAPPRRTFLIPTGPSKDPRAVQTEVLELRSFSWVENGESAAGSACNGLLSGASTMRFLRSGYAQHVLRSVSALRIQRAWRKAVAGRRPALRRKRSREEPSAEAGGDPRAGKLQKTFCTIS